MSKCTCVIQLRLIRDSPATSVAKSTLGGQYPSVPLANGFPEQLSYNTFSHQQGMAETDSP